MFVIEWLKADHVVEKETSILADQTAVIANAKRRALDVAGRLPGREPDSFRLKDAEGMTLGVFPVKGG